ncbi:MAG: 2Fe-2S iron-sulfur cluster-binding protein [Actinomycetes bacterium]
MTAPATVTTGSARGTGGPAGFHLLTVVQVEPLTDEAVVLTLLPPAHLAGQYAFAPGQHVTVRRVLPVPADGSAAVLEHRRSYSICSTPSEGGLRIGVKRLAGGVVSSWLTEQVRVGDRIEVAAPAGSFVLPEAPEPGALAGPGEGVPRHVVAVVAGSGITPVLAIMSATLADEPNSTFTLVYGNRTLSSTMFVDAIADLKDRYLARLVVLPVFSQEPAGAPLLSGRLDRGKLDAILARLVDAPRVHDWLLCGPYALVEAARGLLVDRGVPAERVHRELFFVEQAPPRRTAEQAAALGAPGQVRVTATLGGRAVTFDQPRSDTVLHGLLAVRPDAPYSCTAGVCATCRARVVRGEVVMDHPYALEPDEQAAGYVLTCQSHALGDELVLDYDG